MTINLMQYTHILPRIQSSISQYDDYNPDIFINNMTVITGCPIIVICYYIMKIKGENEFLKDKIIMLQNFYRYDNIVGVKELGEL